MCIIEAMGILDNTHPGDPIEDNKLSCEYADVRIVLDDQGWPRGRFLNDIARWTLRGIAEWMSKNDHFRQVQAKVF